MERIWQRDATVWGDPATPELADRLGWLRVEDAGGRLGAYERLAAAARREDVEWVVLLGMGGSSLAPEVLRRSFGDRPGAPRLRVLDSVHPDAVHALERDVGDLAKVLFVVATKSGGTLETLSLFRHFDERAKAGARFAAITDPGSSLETLARERGFRWTVLGDPEVGGRFSALTAFGLVPAALAGIDAGALVRGAAEAARACRGEGAENPGLLLGALIGEAALRGRDKLTLAIDPPLDSLGLWVEQLVAESTGKGGRGVLPVDLEPPAPPEVYPADRVFLEIPTAAAGMTERAEALIAAGQPLATLAAPGPEELGRLFFVLEFATAVAGWALGVNPFDQPDVQDAKDRTKSALAAPVADAPPDAPAAEPAEALARLLDGAAPPAFLALLAYLPPDAATDHAVELLRRALRDRTGCATTFGYGPRYLHSTGQLHKGGPPNGRFLVVLGEPAQELPVPGEPWGLGALAAAQAVADVEALRARGLPAELVRLPAADAPALLAALAAGLPGAR